METRPRKQEQEPAADEAIEVAPGVVRIQLPISMPGLGHVNCYLLEDERGAAIVDPGLPGASAFRELKRRLTAAGIPLDRVHTVIVTHSHPDHFGGAGRVRHETGADIVTHERFRLMWDPGEPPDTEPEGADDAESDAAEDPDPSTRSRMPWDAPPWGGPGYPVPRRTRATMRLARHLPRLARTPRPTVRVTDAQPVNLARREWLAVYTPGHTDDHICLFDPHERILLSGDHVLPTITPHIGGLVRAVDPLENFFGSLDKVAALGADVDVVLPAHGHPFADLAGRAAAIKQHHVDRLQTLRDAAERLGRPASVQELSEHLFSSRALGPMADSETFAHLEHLRLAGDFERHEAATGFVYAPR